MKMKQVLKKGHKFANPFRVNNGEKFRLKDVDPGDTLGFKSEDQPHAKEALAAGVQALAELQDKLYAQDKWAVLLIFQAMDAAGKDGTIKHVMSGVNPQGCQVFSSSRLPPKTSIMAIFGAVCGACRIADISGSSIGAITRKCWWSAYTRSSWGSKGFRRL